MRRISCLLAVTALLPACTADAQTTNPFAAPISTANPIVVDVVDFAAVPDAADGAARMMLLVEEPVSGRLFVNDMRGPLYTVSGDGRSVTLYVDIDDARWGVGVEAGGRE